MLFWTLLDTVHSPSKGTINHPRGVVAQMSNTENDVRADRTLPTLRDADTSQGGTFHAKHKHSKPAARSRAGKEWSSLHKTTVSAEIYPAACLTKNVWHLLPKSHSKQHNRMSFRGKQGPGSSWTSLRRWSTGKAHAFSEEWASSEFQTQKIFAMQECVPHLLPIFQKKLKSRFLEKWILPNFKYWQHLKKKNHFESRQHSACKPPILYSGLKAALAIGSSMEEGLRDSPLIGMESGE